MKRIRAVRRLAAALIVVGAAALGGCVLVPTPVPVAAPVVIAPRPAYGYGYYPPYGYWRRY